MVANQYIKDSSKFKEDTLFVVFCKTADINLNNYKKFIQSDTLDYLVAITNFRSEVYKEYYSLNFLVTIYPK